MNEKDFSPKEKAIMTLFLKPYWDKLNDAIQRQKTTLYSNNPSLLASINQDMIKIQNWINMEITIFEVDNKLMQQNVLSNSTWKKINSDARKSFINKIKLFVFDTDAIIFQDKKSLVKPMSDIVLASMFNSLNS